MMIWQNTIMVIVTWSSLEVDLEYPKKLHEFNDDLSFLPEEMKIEKVKKHIKNLYEKSEYVIHIRNLKQGFSHGLLLKYFHRVINFNQKAWLNSYVDMNTKLR